MPPFLKRSLRHSRLVLGLVSAALAPVLVAFAYMMLPSFIPWPTGESMEGMGEAAAVSLGLAAIGVLLFGLPAILWLDRHGRLGWPAVVAASVPAGAVYAVLVSWLLTRGATFPGVPGAGLGALLGLCSGVGFCVGARLGTSATGRRPCTG